MYSLSQFENKESIFNKENPMFKKMKSIGKNGQISLTRLTVIQMKCKSIETIRLDPDELHEGEKIGEGAFGIVYKGSFRGHSVAIKEMKGETNIGDDEEMIKIKKEVAMLVTFRCDFIVHFYGSVFMPNKICIVTEFAQFGSLRDLIRQRVFISEKVRTKILLDVAKGIEYIHNHGILHRDINPSNVLIFDIEHHEDGLINGKLTEFRCAKNMNLVTSGMSFTKGIGTPVYMSPEVLKQEDYNKPADIYSFAITMFECMRWGDAYDPKDNQFQFPWMVTDFVMSGKRLEKPLEINDEIFELITQCWCQDPEERMKISNIVQKLQTFQ